MCYHRVNTHWNGVKVFAWLENCLITAYGRHRPSDIFSLPNVVLEFSSSRSENCILAFAHIVLPNRYRSRQSPPTSLNSIRLYRGRGRTETLGRWYTWTRFDETRLSHFSRNPDIKTERTADFGHAPTGEYYIKIVMRICGDCSCVEYISRKAGRSLRGD